METGELTGIFDLQIASEVDVTVGNFDIYIIIIYIHYIYVYTIWFAIMQGVWCLRELVGFFLGLFVGILCTFSVGKTKLYRGMSIVGSSW